MLSRLVSVSMVLLLGAPRLALADDAGPRGVFEKDAVEVQAPDGVVIGEVRIDNRLGDVSVRGHDKEMIAIQSFKRADDEQTLQRLVVSLVPDAQGRVRISTAMRASAEHRPVRAGSVQVDLVVFVPRRAAVNAEIWNGKLRVSKVDNGARLVVDQGSIEVKQVSGAVASDLRRGEQQFAELFGDLDARGIDGSLHMNTVQGERLAATLVRGEINGVRLKVREMEIRSVFGDIEVRAELVAGGKYRVASRRGNVRFRFHGQTAVAMQIRAERVLLGGEMKPEQSGPGQWRGQFGAQNKVRPAQLEVRADTGKVLVKHF